MSSKAFLGFHALVTPVFYSYLGEGDRRIAWKLIAWSMTNSKRDPSSSKAEGESQFPKVVLSDGLAGKGVCRLAWQPEFNPYTHMVEEETRLTKYVS